MDFLKNPMVVAGIGSAVRAMIVALASYLGVEANDGEIDKVVGFATAGLLAAASLAWSWWANKKKIAMDPKEVK